MARSNPKVSIVIPVYNGANYLADAINSALEQTYPNVEILVIDDGSDDRGATSRVARSYGDKIRYYVKSNGGVADALNYGIKKMEGSYFSWLSHDDLYIPTKIEEEMELLQSLSDEKAIVASNAMVLYGSGIKKKTYIDSKVFKDFEIFLAIDAEVGVNGCTLLIPKRALIESGGFNSRLPVTQDYDLWYRLRSKYEYNFYLLDRHLTIYRRHDKQDSVKKQRLCVEAGDDLRATILTNIGRDKFDAYLKASPANLRYAMKNYRLYRDRQHIKCASLLLYGILKHHHLHDKKLFYKVYASELATELTKEIKSKTVYMNRELKLKVENEYSLLNKGWPSNLPIKNHATKKSVPPKNPLHRSIWVLYQSLRRDGIYLTAEKVVRQIIILAKR